MLNLLYLSNRPVLFPRIKRERATKRFTIDASQMIPMGWSLLRSMQAFLPLSIDVVVLVVSCRANGPVVLLLCLLLCWRYIEYDRVKRALRPHLWQCRLPSIGMFSLEWTSVRHPCYEGEMTGRTKLSSRRDLLLPQSPLHELRMGSLWDSSCY